MDRFQPLTIAEWRNYLRATIDSWPEWRKRCGPDYWAPVPKEELINKNKKG